jgi:uncharacterized membrane protein (UPF0127 family)
MNRTHEARTRGRQWLPSDAGVLFLQPQIVSMWMKNTLIPPDMLFIDARGRIVCLLEKTKPESLDIRSHDRPVGAVPEINGAEAHKRGLRVGDRVAQWPARQDRVTR